MIRYEFMARSPANNDHNRQQITIIEISKTIGLEVEARVHCQALPPMVIWTGTSTAIS